MTAALIKMGIAVMLGGQHYTALVNKLTSKFLKILLFIDRNIATFLKDGFKITIICLYVCLYGVCKCVLGTYTHTYTACIWQSQDNI